MRKGEGQEWEKEWSGVWTELAMEGTLNRTLVQADGSREPPPQLRKALRWPVLQALQRYRLDLGRKR